MAGELEGLQDQIPQRKALSMSMMPDVSFNSPDPTTGRKKIGRKIAKLRREGKTAEQAAGQAFGMARSGDLGSAAKRAAGRPPMSEQKGRK